MSIRTSMLEFRVDTNLFSNKGYQDDIAKKVENALKCFNLKIQQQFLSGPNLNCFFSDNDSNSMSCVLKILSVGLVTITIDEWNPNATLTNQASEDLRKNLQNLLELRVERIPVLKHGNRGLKFFTTSDERVMEYDFDELVVDIDSPFQNIKIFHSPTLGNCLFLDDLQNLAEKDIAYTRGLMKYGEISYKNKEILILGGGDGGLLHELLKESPKSVTMVDIDQKVIDLCRIHLRGACGDSLDSLTGSNYEVIVDDCIQKMEEYARDQKTFDIIFNDLTDIPIGTFPQEELWAFIEKILTMSLKILKPDGKYLNHATGESAVSGLASYEQLLQRLPVKVAFQNHKAFVPSFMENWVFYEIWKVAH